MAERLRGSTSPYLLAHADNPVDWWPWDEDAFAEARRRNVPVLVSIGYATCHWCHVMARESFSDPEIAALLGERFVAIKVDREEHPEVDAAYLAAAGAFTSQLGWPLTAFANGDGAVFYAGSYFPPRAAHGMPSFRNVLDAVWEAWTERPDEVAETADGLQEALRKAAEAGTGPFALPAAEQLDAAAGRLLAGEDRAHGGFGGAPKFPAAPMLEFLAGSGDEARAAVDRALQAMSASELRDPVEGGFFRYATRADWTVPHYERMLTDNAQLLALLLPAASDGAEWARTAAEGIAGFLTTTMRLPGGCFASAQDSESLVDGRSSEGGYYRLNARERAEQPSPKLDRKVLTGWNGLTIGALADASVALERPELLVIARRTAEAVLDAHLREDGTLVRSSLDGRPSAAPATLEDTGMLAGGLIRLALASGEPRHAVTARSLLDGAIGTDGRLRGGRDPVLAAHGIAGADDAVEGAVPSGAAAAADAAYRLWALGAGERFRDAAERTIAPHTAPALERPAAYGAILAVARRLAEPLVQLVTVTAAEGEAGGELVRASRGATASIAAVVDEAQARAWADAGFELFAGRGAVGGASTAYLCRDFVCRLPVTDAAGLRAAAAG
ncbi:thioredoxin domain-containing protein [Agromyces archimandritae]|uniref:Thioredoxin domain-containing protein n=1 Tax=Agromyces archimandritae TaxID=2781962 RepID=A0A975FL14_9MICO|nr:DUF255 domain-containing protein [Agromyces archimandritae]QTX04045.1 thioredoxin domain-containing protein [Agromyces archimandritae]